MRSDSLDTARPRIMEQLEQSFRNLAPEFHGSEAHDSRGGGSPERPFRIVPPQRRCQQTQNGVQRQGLAPEQRAVEDRDVVLGAKITCTRTKPGAGCRTGEQGEARQTQTWPSIEWSLAATMIDPVGLEWRASRPRQRGHSKDGGPFRVSESYQVRGCL